jgi:hypothetical protein
MLTKSLLASVALAACVCAMSMTSRAETVYNLAELYAGSQVVPDLLHTDTYPLTGTLTTHDDTTDIDYMLSWGGNDYAGVLEFVSQTPHVEIGGVSIAPSIRNYSDLGEVTFSMFAEGATPMIAPDALFADWNAALFTFIGDLSEDTRYASVAVPEIGADELTFLGVVGLLFFWGESRRCLPLLRKWCGRGQVMSVS